MGSTKEDIGGKPSAGDALAAVSPAGDRPWYKQGHLLGLNLIILSLALDQWKIFMNNPTGAKFGWLNMIYWLGCGVGYPTASCGLPTSMAASPAASAAAKPGPAH
ncbi:uncharacterized protein BO97DRAFT_428847 [Aspergillus homomorphus CBS 101889]|uniref:Uncharacterized protein n=1 Tax=Aspergillus homomorphus (strain CBS 101889) TaxID=1450537 RepID=A0A395HJH3_ASPHC|nr:hypothetical protein BO97DRAFT_428847 [Aspergillus homomorphus CBS 101889]RAL07920.1 hypothetical protein BO97DRAFT_428847 [Aspergillus homomorphus CBS 101889]